MKIPRDQRGKGDEMTRVVEIQGVRDSVPFLFTNF